MDNVILIGKQRILEIYRSCGWENGEDLGEFKVDELSGILNPMSYKQLKNFEQGKYTIQDKVFYTKKIIDTTDIYTFVDGTKYIIDDIKSWDDSKLVKYILKRCING